MLSLQQPSRAYAARKQERAERVEDNWRKLAAVTVARIHTPRSMGHVFSSEDAVSIVYMAMRACGEKSRAYQWRAGINAIHDEVRSIRGRKGERDINLYRELDENEAAGLPGTGSFANRVHSRMNINTLITLLPDTRWQIIIERLYVDEMLPEDIAAEIGLSLGRVSQMKTEALAFLKTIINEDGCLREGEPLN